MEKLGHSPFMSLRNQPPHDLVFADLTMALIYFLKTIFAPCQILYRYVLLTLATNFLFFGHSGALASEANGSALDAKVTACLPLVAGPETSQVMIDEAVALYMNTLPSQQGQSSRDPAPATVHRAWQEKIEELHADYPGVQDLIHQEIQKRISKHSQDLEGEVDHELTPYEEDLENLETINEELKFDVCQRSPEIQLALERKLGKECDLITKTDLLKVKRLTISFRSGQPTELREFDLYGLRHLKEVSFFGTLLHSIPENIFQHLPDLTHIDLASNNLNQLPKGIFRGLHKLRRLELGNNELTHMDEDIFNDLENLRALSLSDNPSLGGLPENIFKGSPRLEELDLSNIKMKTLPPQLLKNLHHLTQLVLSANEMETPQPGSFDDLTSLVKLDLHNNKITSISPSGAGDRPDPKAIPHQMPPLTEDLLAKLTQLKTIHLNDNQLQWMPPHFFQNNRNLEYISISNNSISVLDEETFHGLIQLGHLLSSDNELTALEAKLIYGLVNLRHVSFANNEIEIIPGDFFKDNDHLGIVDLKSNRLKSLSDTALQNLNKLITLDISHNLLSELSQSIFNGLTEVNQIELSSNELREISSQHFTNNQKLQSLNLQGNPLSEASFNELNKIFLFSDSVSLSFLGKKEGE